MNTRKYTQLIKQRAKELGFEYCGVAKAAFLEEEAPLLERWLKEGQHGKMQYMENYFDMRLDPRKLVDGAKSVVSFALNYFPERELGGQYKISKYAYGKDYHFVIKEKLRELIAFIREEIGEVNGRGFVDSAPVLDKAWAKRSGIGWIGKNANLLNRTSGSFFFLAELVLDLELEYDEPETANYCGTCTRCIDACPTQAIIKPNVVDGSRCISYFTIELKEAIPQEVQGSYGNWIFGCDVCQDVCPWNRFSKPHKEPAFNAGEELQMLTEREWEEITEDVFARVFKGSAVKRTGHKGLKRNIDFLKKLS